MQLHKIIERGHVPFPQRQRLANLQNKQDPDADTDKVQDLPIAVRTLRAALS